MGAWVGGVFRPTAVGKSFRVIRYPGPFYQSRWQFYQGWPAYGRFINNGRFIKVEDQAAMAALSIRSGKIARSLRFGLRMADFILSCVRSLSAAKPNHF